MHRPTRRLLGSSVIALCALATTVSGCSVPPEQQVIKNYFDASRMRDNLTLANIAAVSFSPQEQGVVRSFDITSVAEEQRRTLRIRELSEAYEAARAAEDAFGKKMKDYQDANIEAIDRVLKAEREDRTVRGRDASVQEAWTKFREETKVHAQKTSEAREALNDERSVAELSVFDAQNPVDLTRYSGDLVSKEVTLDARVQTPDGQTVNKTFVVTMQRVELKSADGRDLPARWIITRIQESGPAATS